jgi:hypothetical protein
MIVDVIHTYFRQRYDPTFRRGPNVWSNALCREISRAEACAAPASTIIPGLLAATDFPRGEAGPKRSAIPGAYRQWAPFAWADLLSCLPDEADSPEIAESAADEFNASVSELMLTIEAMAYVHRNHGNQTERSEIQRRSLIHWAQLFAKPGPWKPIRSLALWCRIGEDGGLCVAIHQRLFAQMRRGSLAAYTHRRFVQLAEMYGVGVASRTATTRFVELTSQFLSGLISAPDDGPGDGTDDDASHARSAHRTSSSPSSSSSSKEGVKG